jgi:hypothetical protein
LVYSTLNNCKIDLLLTFPLDESKSTLLTGTTFKVVLLTQLDIGIPYVTLPTKSAIRTNYLDIDEDGYAIVEREVEQLVQVFLVKK